MALKEILDSTSQQDRKIGMSKERFDAIMPTLRQQVAQWRDYPDMFIDFLQTGANGKIPEGGLHFQFYQRIFLRACLRYKYTFFVFPRGQSKSFLTVLSLVIKCILYPGAKLFVTSGGKEQSAGILKEKVDELCALVPALTREIDWRPGKTSTTKNQVYYLFKNGSSFDNVAASEKSRGKRRHGGVVEECVGVDGQILSQVIIPMMNVSRNDMDGTKHDEEPLNKSQVWITTAGYKNTFSYTKLIQYLIWMITDPEKAQVMGGTWRIPVLVGLQDKNFISDIRKDETYDEASFEREYESMWTGTVEGSFFNGDHFDRGRILLKPEYEYTAGRGHENSRNYYVLGVDVGRIKCDSVVCVFKVRPLEVGAPVISLVNIYVLNDENLLDQAIVLKRLYYKYHALKIVIDGNGLGHGLIDAMVKPSLDPETGEEYPDFGIENDKDNEYKKFQTKNTEFDAIYNMKANPAINTACHSNVVTQMSSGKIKFLIDERSAKLKLLGTRVGKEMTPEQRKIYLRPYQLTSILKDEMLNLREETQGLNIVLKQANKQIPKDKFSSFEYGLWYIKENEGKKKKKKFKASDWLFLN